MNDDKQLKTDTIEGGCDDCGLKSSNTSRRKFTKGAFAAPVLASLVSTPVWGTGGGGGACSISGLRSGNTSSARDRTCKTNGCTPGFWKTRLDAWPCAGYNPGTCKTKDQKGRCTEWNTSTGDTFDFAFGFDFPLAPGKGYTLLDVMLDHKYWGSHGTFYNHLVAALLNASCSPFAYGATAQQVIDLAKDLDDQGGNIRWRDAHEVIVRMNEAGNCFLNAHGDCQGDLQRAVIAPGEEYCIPACQDGYHYDVNTHQCVPDTL